MGMIHHTGTRIRVTRFFILRPALAWSLLSLIFLVFLLFMIRWDKGFDLSDFSDMDQFEMVDLTIPQTESEPEINISENEQEPVEELSFGDENGEYNEMSERATAPRPVFQQLPSYPDSMREAGIEGIVVIELGIDTDGSVLYGKIVQSLGRDFDVIVLKWAMNIRFYPALDPEGKPFRCRINLPVRFSLER